MFIDMFFFVCPPSSRMGISRGHLPPSELCPVGAGAATHQNCKALGLHVPSLLAIKNNKKWYQSHPFVFPVGGAAVSFYSLLMGCHFAHRVVISLDLKPKCTTPLKATKSRGKKPRPARRAKRGKPSLTLSIGPRPRRCMASGPSTCRSR